MNIDKAVADILRREGSKFTNKPADKGGPTKFGITQRTLASWRHHPVDAEDVELLTAEEARNIYLTDYIRKPGFSLIEDDPLGQLVVDTGVLYGPQEAAQWLQEALGTKPDGIFGPMTYAALRAAPSVKALHDYVLRRRFKKIGSRVAADPSQAEFADGWINRACEFIS